MENKNPLIKISEWVLANKNFLLGKSVQSIEPPSQLIWWVSGATPVQLGWKGWKLCSLWIVS